MVTERQKILVVGCGSLGSEVIKLIINLNIKLSIIDFDLVDVSNLNRQFFFSLKDVGRHKSQITAEKLQAIGIDCEYCVGKLEDMDFSYYEHFDTIFSCLDSVSGRMELNYKLHNSKFFEKGIFVDSGVEKLDFHVKKVDRKFACLYCMYELYRLDDDDYLCSLTNVEIISIENRDKALRSIIMKHMDEPDNRIERIVTEFNSKIIEFNDKNKPIILENKYSKSNNTGNNINSEDKHMKNIKIIGLKNSECPLNTNEFEVKGIIDKLIPNICTTNSICASNAVLLAFGNTEYDFVFFEGSNTSKFCELILEKDPTCFVCNTKNERLK